MRLDRRRGTAGARAGCTASKQGVDRRKQQRGRGRTHGCTSTRAAGIASCLFSTVARRCCLFRCRHAWLGGTRPSGSDRQSRPLVRGVFAARLFFVPTLTPSGDASPIPKGRFLARASSNPQSALARAQILVSLMSPVRRDPKATDDVIATGACRRRGQHASSPSSTLFPGAASADSHRFRSPRAVCPTSGRLCEHLALAPSSVSSVPPLLLLLRKMNPANNPSQANPADRSHK